MDHTPPFLNEAQRLVLSGRLAEATNLIQARLNGRDAPAAEPAAPFRGPTIELTAEPRAAEGRTGGARTAEPKAAAAPPRSRPRFPLAGGGPLGSASPFAAAAMPGGARPAPSLPPIPKGAAFLRLRHESPAGARDYRLYVPASGGTGPRPLLVMLHGCTQNPEDFAVGTRMNAAAEALGVLVAYPEQPRSANPSLCWNWFDPAHQRGEAGEPAILAGIVEAVARAHAVDRTRIFVAGLSAGGAMAAVLGAVRPDLFAAVGVHSGLPYGSAEGIPAALSVMRSGRGAAGRGLGVPAIVFHGARDTTVHPANGERVAGLDAGKTEGRRTVSGSAGGRAYTRTLLAADATRPAAEHWRIEGLAHAWSGGDAAGSHADPGGPDASREMLRFFLEHPRRPAG